MRYEIPSNTGKVRVAMFLGNKYAVWNGKQGRGEFRIICRTRKQAEDLVKLINSRDRPKWIDVFD